MRQFQLDTSYPFDNTLADNDFAATCQADSGNATVFRLFIPYPTTVTLTTTENTFDTIISVRTTCDAPATEIGCNDNDGPGGDAPAHGSQLVLDLNAGGHYVWIHGYQGAQGEGMISIETTP